MVLLIDRQGQVHCLYCELVDLTALGLLTIRRASHVEPDPIGNWWADLAPLQGPKLGPFVRRSEALTAEQRWIELHALRAANPDRPSTTR